MLTIMLTTVRRKFTDRVTLLNLIVLPILLIVILGNALSSTFATPTTAAAATTTLAVVNLDRSPASSAVVTQLTTADSGFAAHAVADTERARAELMDRTSTVAVIIQSGFGSADASGAGQIELLAVDSNTDSLKASQIAFDAYSEQLLATQIVAAAGTPQPWQPRSQPKQPSASTSTDHAAGLSGVTYYTVTMAVLILMYGMANTMNFVRNEYDGPLGDRYLASPVSKAGLIGSQLVAGMLSSAVQVGVLLLTASVVFGATLAGSVPSFIGVAAVAVVLFNSLGLLFGLVGRGKSWFDPLMSIAIPAFTFLGGGFVKINFGGLERLSPNSLFQNAFFDAIQRVRFDWVPLQGCLLLAAAGLVWSGFILRGKDAR